MNYREGQVNDIVHAWSLISRSPNTEVVCADKGYDSDQLRRFIEEKRAVANIPRKVTSKAGNTHMDWCLYTYRHLIENAFFENKEIPGRGH